MRWSARWPRRYCTMCMKPRTARKRRVVGRDAGLVQHVAAGLRLRPADPAADHRHDLGAGGTRHGARRLDRRGERGRHVHRQHRAHAAIVGQGVERGGVARTVGVAHDVDRIAVRPGARQRLVEHAERARQERRELAALVHQQVGGDDAGAAAVGQDGQPLVARRAAMAQRLGGVEQLAQPVHAHQPGAREGRVIDRGRSRHGAGMRGRGLGGGGVAARLQHDHRLHARDAARGRHELARLGDALDVHQHGARVVVARQHVQNVAEVDVGHVAHGDQVREADVLRGAPVGEPGQHGARLRDGGDAPGLELARPEAGVEADAGARRSRCSSARRFAADAVGRRAGCACAIARCPRRSPR